MSTYIDGLIDTELGRARDGIAIAMNEVADEFTVAGAYGGSRMFIQYQARIAESITNYANVLRNRLAQFDPKHAPISVTDFHKAINSVDTLGAFAVAEYQRRQTNHAQFGGGYGVPMDEPRLMRAVIGGQTEIRGLQSQFRSQRSPWGRVKDILFNAFGQQAALAAWTGLVFALGIAAKSLFDRLW